jgi:thiamine transport system substrate-binding protein
MRTRILGLCAAMLAFGAAVATAQQTLTVLTHDSFSASKDVIAAFEQETGAKVSFVTGGDAGSTLSKAILTKDNPIADVIFGVDNTFLSRALAAGILLPYDSPVLARIPADLRLDPTDRMLPVDYGYVCPVYDRAWFAAHHVTLPTTLDELTRPIYKGLLVMENPAVSSPGLAFLMATIAAFGDTGSSAWQSFWQGLRANDVLVVNDWNEAYYNQFSGAGPGRRPIVISYSTDPAASMFFAPEPKPKEPQVGTLLVPGAVFRQVEFVGILARTKHLSLARQWVDFMLSRRFQEDIPQQMWVYPANPQAALPALFTRFAPAPGQFETLAPALINEDRDAWIRDWTRVVLQ